MQQHNKGDRFMKVEYLNSDKLNDSGIGQYQKLKTTMSLNKITYKKLDIIASLLEVKSRNTALENAINFYFSYLTNTFNQEYLCDVYGNKMASEIKILSDRLAKLQFKNAVEIDMLTRIVANDLEMGKETYDKLRKTAVDCVKTSNGTINLYDATNSQY